MENWRRFVNEDIDANKIDSKLFPTKLSVAKQQAGISSALATTGQDDNQQADDIAQSKLNVPFSCNKLLPGQTTMDLDKFVGMAIQMFLKIGGFPNGPGGDLGAIISSDNHIMDGHHRWAGSLCVNPDSQVSGLQVSVPGQKLVGILNVWTVAHGGSGKASTHKLADLSGDVVSKRILELCNSGLTGGKKPISSQELLEAAKKANTTFEQIAATAKQNWDGYNPKSKIQDWMPTKMDMPAIEPEQLIQVAQDIQSGKMDLSPPYSKATIDQAKKKRINLQSTPAEKPGAPTQQQVQKESLRKLVKKIVMEELHPRKIMPQTEKGTKLPDYFTKLQTGDINVDVNEIFQRHLKLLHNKLNLNENVDINQVASTLEFKPVTKQKLIYKYVEDVKPSSMPPMTYTKSKGKQNVVTTTTDGKETQNVAEDGDIIMSGATGENYVIKGAKFSKLYHGNVGEDVYPEQSPRQVALYTGGETKFKAPWGEDMVIKPGDYLVKDPANTGYYRIAKVEFEKTYNKL